jgi:predicted peptidase
MIPLHALPLSLIFLIGACASTHKEVDSKMNPQQMFVEGTIEAFEDGSARSYSYRLLKPSNFAGEQRPLLVFLHGVGERGSDNLQQLKYLPTWMCSSEWRERFDTYVLAMQCPGDEIWVGSWDGAGTCRAMIAVERAIEHLIESENIDSSRVYLTGLSMGGYGSWALAAHRPDLFAGLVPICGGGDPATVERLRGMPIWVFHGTADDVVQESNSMEMVSALRAVGIPVGYTRLAGVGHDSWTDAYLHEGAINWLFSQQRP